jgi:hypothetical protein
MVLETKRRGELAKAIPDQAHAKLTVGERIPAFRDGRISGRLPKTWNRLLLLGPSRPAQPEDGAEATDRLEEQTSASRMVHADLLCHLETLDGKQVANAAAQ